jgi:DNA-binding response OmpR family regulator
MKRKIRIVEEEAIFYRNLRNFPEKNNYEVSDYTKSVDEAIEKIENEQPDLVLLDIDLVGEKTGIDLGKIL